MKSNIINKSASKEWGKNRKKDAGSVRSGKKATKELKLSIEEAASHTIGEETTLVPNPAMDDITNYFNEMMQALLIVSAMSMGEGKAIPKEAMDKIVEIGCARVKAYALEKHGIVLGAEEIPLGIEEMKVPMEAAAPVIDKVPEVATGRTVVYDPLTGKQKGLILPKGGTGIILPGEA